MARSKLLFYGAEGSDSESSELECLCGTSGEYIFLSISDNRGDKWIALDKSTAIKLSKTLKTEISKIIEEGSND